VLGDLLGAPARRAALAVAGVEHAAHFSWDRTADGLLDVYTDAIGENRRRTRACA
jgi:D-inositol-3-phosphate glycosyltransferase